MENQPSMGLYNPYCARSQSTQQSAPVSAPGETHIENSDKKSPKNYVKLAVHILAFAFFVLGIVLYFHYSSMDMRTDKLDNYQTSNWLSHILHHYYTQSSAMCQAEVENAKINAYNVPLMVILRYIAVFGSWILAVLLEILAVNIKSKKQPQ